MANKPFSVRVQDEVRAKFDAVLAVKKIDASDLFEDMINEYIKNNLTIKEQRAFKMLYSLYNSEDEKGTEEQ